MKTCGTCKITKELTLFSKKGEKGFSSVCKECHSTYRKQKYIENREKELEQVRNYQKNLENKNIIRKKSGRIFELPCKNPNCENNAMITKKNFNESISSFCSRECMALASRSSNCYLYLKGVHKRAVKRGLDFNLTEEYLNNLLIEQNHCCAVTNIPIILKHRTEDTKIYESASLDRINSDLGYVEGNVQWVALGINYMKLDHSNEDLLKLVSLILEHNKKEV